MPGYVVYLQDGFTKSCLLNYSIGAPYSFIALWGGYSKSRVATISIHAVRPQEYKLKWWCQNYHVQFNARMFPAKSGADSKHNTAVTDTVNRGSGREGRNEVCYAAAVCQCDSCEWHTEQEAPVACWRWKQEQSKSLLALWCRLSFKVWCLAPLQFLCQYLGAVWDLVTVYFLVPDCYLHIIHHLQFFASTRQLFWIVHYLQFMC